VNASLFLTPILTIWWLQVRVPYRVVGLVVGPKGATIKRIQQQTHTYIVTPSREKDPVFEVTGMPENVDRAREEIETHITLRTGAFVDLFTTHLTLVSPAQQLRIFCAGETTLLRYAKLS